MTIRAELTKQYEDFLNPAVLRPRLLAASVFITGFESLKVAIVDRLSGLYWRGFNQEGEEIDPRYDVEVRSRHRSLVRASLMWLVEEGAIEQTDLDTYDRVRVCRNLLAHELLDVVSSQGLPEDFDIRFEELIELLRKIEVWWIQNVELAINPVYVGQEVDPAEIVPGRLIALQVLCDVALGPEDKSLFWYDGFRNKVAEVEEDMGDSPDNITGPDGGRRGVNVGRKLKERVMACECGCGEEPGGGQFVSGHDQVLRVALEAEVGGLLELRALVRSAQEYADGARTTESFTQQVRTLFAGVERQER